MKKQNQIVVARLGGLRGAQCDKRQARKPLVVPSPAVVLTLIDSKQSATAKPLDPSIWRMH
jgi:hypothetical protein